MVPRKHKKQHLFCFKTTQVMSGLVSAFFCFLKFLIAVRSSLYRIISAYCICRINELKMIMKRHKDDVDFTGFFHYGFWLSVLCLPKTNSQIEGSSSISTWLIAIKAH